MLRRFQGQVHSVSWSSIVVDTGDLTLKRIPLWDPTKGTQKRVGSLIGRAGNVRDLVNELSPAPPEPERSSER